MVAVLLVAGFRKTWILKKILTQWVFWILLGFRFYWVFRFFYLNEQSRSLLVDLAHQLSFYLDSPLLRIIQKLKFITYWLLEGVNIKKSLIITGMTN